MICEHINTRYNQLSYSYSHSYLFACMYIYKYLYTYTHFLFIPTYKLAYICSYLYIDVSSFCMIWLCIETLSYTFPLYIYIYIYICIYIYTFIREIIRGSVLQQPDDEFFNPSKIAVEKYLIKWLHASYLHVSWETEKDLLDLCGPTAKVYLYMYLYVINVKLMGRIYLKI
jgi:hypothetical protein